MAWRMLDYRMSIRSQFRQERIEQRVIYFGREPLRTPCGIQEPDLSFRYRLLDIRDFDPEPLLASPVPSDRLLALMCRGIDPRRAVRRMLESWAPCPPRQRQDLVTDLLLAAGLRNLNKLVREEINVIRAESWLENTWLKEVYDGGMAKARRSDIRRILEKRFGVIPGWLDEKLTVADPEQLESLIDRALDAPTLDAVFQ